MSTYQYENLNPESFQQLCQSLLVKEYPGLQCYPVGQPDGGRDATSPFSPTEPDSNEFILFQVKFARRELSPLDARKWLLRTLKNELPKIHKQVANGAKKFVLVTNVEGTAHHKTGSMDKLQALLDEYIPIDAQALWRCDLDTRMDNSMDLKFKYPSIIAGDDLLSLIVEAGQDENSERRQNAVTAFLTHQFEADREVKFKQIELESDIFDLFTDVPIIPRLPPEERDTPTDQLASAFYRSASSVSGDIRPFVIVQWLENATGIANNPSNHFRRDETWMNAATLLLDDAFQQSEPFVILQGAPGQGKSTIAQYICQIHRMRVLGDDAVNAPNPIGANAAFRLPFKVEIRDFASWLNGGNPFGNLSGVDRSAPSAKTLENFLSVLIQSASGGTEFSVADLHYMIRRSPVLVVLDGLDEVAEIRQRERVVEEITSAVSRLNALALSMQVVVTSRPTAFINSAVLPTRRFATYSLESLTRPLIDEYADRWLQSRAIDESEATDVRRILHNQLNEPHLRDLARNPMQLAILLSLIHRQGVSLPEKRTALYDNYVSLFFDRESEKSLIVKNNRDLLVRIHRHLAWVLQSGAETTTGSRTSFKSFSGTITEEELRAEVKEFLEREKSDPSLVDTLFSGMVERVVVIVSRVQGIYEFDVQTLREYFVARHLYETAPYSPTGDERSGTKSDRWRALSRNYYWLNVARFYAGCYSEGELASLIYELRGLRDDDAFRLTSHPQMLTAILLGDWVFSQKPQTVMDAVDLILESRGLRMLLAGGGSARDSFDDVVVSDLNGRDRLIAACKELVKPTEHFDQVMMVARRVLLPNSDPHSLLKWWLEEMQSADESDCKHWNLLGDQLQCWSMIGVDDVAALMDGNEVPSWSVVNGLLRSGRMDIIEGDEGLFDAALEAVLAGELVGWLRGESLLERMEWSIDPTTFVNHHHRHVGPGRMSLLEYLDRYTGFKNLGTDNVSPSFANAERCARVIEAFIGAAASPLSVWDTTTEPWGQIVETGISEFGQHRRWVELANVAAGIRSKEEQCEDSPDLFDLSRPLVRRARYARLRAGTRKWWSNQLQSATNADEAWMALLILFTWASGRTIEGMSEELDNIVENLGRADWNYLFSSLRKAVDANSLRSWVNSAKIRVDALPPSLSHRTAALMTVRCRNSAVASDLYDRYLSDYHGDDPVVLSVRTDMQIIQACRNEGKWSQAIEGLRSNYDAGVPVGRGFFEHLARRRVKLPKAVAKEIAENPMEFPVRLVNLAEARCRELNASRISPVGRVAAEDGWFGD